MARAIGDIEREIRNLSGQEKERLLRVLLKELEGPPDPEVERVWLEEVQRRSRELEQGLVKPVSGEEVSARAREELKKSMKPGFPPGCRPPCAQTWATVTVQAHTGGDHARMGGAR